jgi:hypothetical protein
MVREWQVDLEDHIHLEDQAHDVAIKGVASTKRDLDTRMANLARLSEEFCKKLTGFAYALPLNFH